MYTDELQQVIAEQYLAYRQSMIKRAYSRIHNISDAEDIVSECWISLLCHPQILLSLSPKALSAYIMRSLDNKIVDFIRSSRRIVRMNTVCSAKMRIQLTENLVLPNEAQLRRTGVESLLMRLSPRERTVAQMKWENYDTHSIALAMGIAESSVRVYWMRTKKDYAQKPKNSLEIVPQFGLTKRLPL